MVPTDVQPRAMTPEDDDALEAGASPSVRLTKPRGPADRLLPHVGWFVRQSTFLILGPAFVVVAALRLVMGELSGWDAFTVAAVVSVESCTEWCLHRFVLHLAPFTWRGRTVELHPAAAHRRHHLDPNDPATTPIGPTGTVVFLAVLALIALPIPPLLGIRVTGVLTGVGLMIAYEWTHYLIHSAYRPRHAWYRRTWRAHRLHHFRDDTSWYGITAHGFDHLVGTARSRPDR